MLLDLVFQRLFHKKQFLEAIFKKLFKILRLADFARVLKSHESFLENGLERFVKLGLQVFRERIEQNRLMESLISSC
jgi:hypothetical protein